MVAPQPRTRQHAFPTSRNLLNLDCSADLKSYRRDLGPGVQAKCFEKTSDTIREQLDQHRSFLLRHRQNGQASGLPSPVPRLEVPQSHTASSVNAASPHVNAPSNNYYTASQPRPLQILSQPHAPRQSAPPSRQNSPVPGQIGTYPTGLRQALERCSQYGHHRQPGTVWEVITNMTGSHINNGREAVGTYETLQEANMKAAVFFLSEGYYSEIYEPTYEVRGDGSLVIQSEVDGSLGGMVEIYIKSAPVRRTLGPQRR